MHKLTQLIKNYLSNTPHMDRETTLPDIIILDFDQTITLQHTSGCASPDQLTADYVQQNTKAEFIPFVQFANERAIKLYIATFSDDQFATEPDQIAGHDLVKHYMDTMLGVNQTVFELPIRDPRNQIIQYRSIVAKMSQDFKDFHLTIIAEQEKLNLSDKATLPHILFIDDEKKTLDHIREAGCAILTNKTRTAADMAASSDLFIHLLSWLKT